MTLFRGPWCDVEPYDSARPYTECYDSGPCAFWCPDHRLTEGQTCLEFPQFTCDADGVGPAVFHDDMLGDFLVQALDPNGDPLPPGTFRKSAISLVIVATGCSFRG